MALASRKLFSLYTMCETESKMAMLDATGLDLSQILSRAGLLLGIHSATTKLSASFYNSSGELQPITSDDIMAKVPTGATLFLMQQDINGSPKTVTRRLSISGKPQTVVDSSSTDSMSSVPPTCVQATEEQQKILRHLEEQLHQFELSLGRMSTDPAWRSLIWKISRAVQSCVLRGADMSEQLDGLITPEGELSPLLYTKLPSTEDLDMYAQHCLDDLLHALAALKACASRPGLQSSSAAPQQETATSVVCGA